MKILYETKDTLFITELSLKEIEDIKIYYQNQNRKR